MKRWWIAILVSGMLWSTAPAAAQDARAEARENFNAGVASFESEDYSSALSSFQEAYRLAPHPSVRVNMANCYERLDRPLEALFHYESFLSEARDAPAAQRREVQRAIDGLQNRVGQVTLRVAPDGALVRIDQAEVRRAPIMESIRMVAGSHLVEVRADGYRSIQREFIVEGGQPAEIAIRLERGADPDPTPMPVVTEPDQAGVATTPTNQGRTPPSDVGPEPTPEPIDEGGGGFVLTTPTIIAGAATGALLVGTIITGVLALGANGDFEDAVTRSNDPSLSGADRMTARQDGLDAQGRANTLSMISDVLLVTTIVGAGATAALFFLTQPDDDEVAASGPRIDGATALATPDGAAVMISGAF
jgi:hypothetical protein